MMYYGKFEGKRRRNMKKMASIALIMACIVCLLAGCAEPTTPTEPSTTLSTSAAPSTPAPTKPAEFEKVQIADGTYVFLSGELAMSAIAENTDYGYAPFHRVSVADGTVTGYNSADVFTVTNVDGGITLQDCYGRYLSMADPHNSFNVSAEMPADGHIWTLYCLDGNYKLVNNMNGKTLCYSTSYTSWGIYSKIGSDRNPLIKVIAVEPPADPANA